MDDNVLVETNANQNISIEVNRMGNGVAIIGNVMSTTVDVNVMHHIHPTVDMQSSE